MPTILNTLGRILALISNTSSGKDTKCSISTFYRFSKLYQIMSHSYIIFANVRQEKKPTDVTEICFSSSTLTPFSLMQVLIIYPVLFPFACVTTLCFPYTQTLVNLVNRHRFQMILVCYWL